MATPFLLMTRIVTLAGAAARRRSMLGVGRGKPKSSAPPMGFPVGKSTDTSWRGRGSAGEAEVRPIAALRRLIDKCIAVDDKWGASEVAIAEYQYLKVTSTFRADNHN